MTLEVQQSRTIDFGLQISGINTEVTVTSQVAEIELQRSDASLGQLINAQQVAELPLNGRNFVQLALLGPGTATGRAGSFLAAGTHQRSVVSRQHVGVGAGHARKCQRLAVRRHRRQRTDRRRRGHPAFRRRRSASSRCSPTTSRRSTAAAAARRPGQHQVGRQRVPRHGCSNICATTRWMRATSSTAPRSANGGRTSSASPSAARSSRTRPFSSATSRATSSARA